MKLMTEEERAVWDPRLQPVREEGDAAWNFDERKKTGKSIRLHLGCNNFTIKDWCNIDLFRVGVDIKHNLADPLPFEDNSVDEIALSHVLEHMPHTPKDYEGSIQIRVLKDWRRVLKRGGRLIIIGPNCVFLTNELIRTNSMIPRGEDTDHICSNTIPIMNHYEGAVITIMSGPIFTPETASIGMWAHHWWILTANYVIVQLKALGFSIIKEIEGWPVTEFCVEAYK